MEKRKKLPLFFDTDAQLERFQESPESFVKNMDTSFDSFFYKREYSEHNFTFYL